MSQLPPVLFSSERVPESPRPSVAWLDAVAHHIRTLGDQPAVIAGDAALSYSQLGNLVETVCESLRGLGIGSGDYVGVGLGRCLELPGVLLGILKSGAAYVPIDPAYPSQRIDGMIASASLRAVVTKSELSEVFQDVECIKVDSLSGCEMTDVSFESASMDKSIYAIFTSGSTGAPKAATVYHRGFENLLAWYIEELALCTKDRVLVISSPSFDLTQKNFFALLATGGLLVLDDEATYDITRISALIRKHGITLLNCTPSAFYPLLENAGAGFEGLSSLRFAVLGGEPISIERVRPWLEHASCRAEIVNSYGPTECTDICAFHRLHRGNLDEHAFVPLGREVPNVQVTIRDESLAACEDDELGELWISGAGLGGGYLNDPQRTAHAFVDGFYRTGDLARRLPSGILEFRGRADQQVKVNGFRIELGEIERALNRHDDVREAIVIAPPGRFIAYVMGSATIHALRDHLAASLPHYMIPHEFLFVETFPMTPNGKVDRLKLVQSLNGDRTVTPAANHTEAQILTLWSEVLGRVVDDPDLNFSDAGGNSLHLATIHVRLMRLTGKEFSITELFAMPTARSLARFLSPQQATADSSTRDKTSRGRNDFSHFRKLTKR